MAALVLDLVVGARLCLATPWKDLVVGARLCLATPWKGRKRSKVVPHTVTSIGHGDHPGFLAVSPQATVFVLF